MVPAGLADLDETDARLAETAGHQALPREAAGRAGLHAVRVEDGLRLLGQVEQLRHLALHLEGELVRLNHAVEPVRRVAFRGQVAVHGLDEVDLLALKGLGCPRLQVGEIAAVVDPRPLEMGRQERAAVVDRPAEVRRRVDRHVAGHVLILRSQPIHEPRPHRRAGERGQRRSRVQLNDRFGVGRRIGVKAADVAQPCPRASPRAG